MEPFAALGLVGNIITLVDFSTKLVQAASAARHSASGLPEDLQDAAVITKNLESFLTQLPAPTLPPTASAADKALAELMANCRKTCDQLQELVGKIKGTGSGSRLSSIGVALRGTVNQPKVRELKEQLHVYRSQIMDHFHRIFQEEQSFKLRTLVDTQAGMTGKVAKEMEKQLQETKEQISHMMEYAHASSASVTNTILRDICDRLAELSTRTKNMNAEQEVLNLLWFPELRTRKDVVMKAHEGTYRWLLHDPNTDTKHSNVSPSTSRVIARRGSRDLRETEDRNIWRDNFITWLQAEEDHGHFFISGKPGSGKSTLMKFISQDARTHELLRVWAAQDEKELLLLSFYFWISGTQLQKSTEGLYRSMLWEILRKAPELIEAIFPTLSRKASAGPLHESDLDPSHLADVFQKLLHNEACLRKYRLCFFIDGLDEHEGDRWKLAKDLKSWCSTPSVKLCVSSRPQNDFIAIFGRPGPWLKLHELTGQDIRRVVRDQFAADERVTERQQHSSEFDELTKSLVKKAEGVFIWVVLTIQSLLSGVGNNYSMVQLQKRLDAVPTELSAMYQYIFEKIQKPDREAAARLFLTMTLPPHPRLSSGNNSYPLKSSLFIHSLLDDIHDSPAYAKSLMEGTLGPPICLEEWETKCLSMSDRLTGRCQGLILVCFSRDRTTPAADDIQFVHRTVADFLGQPKIKKEIMQDAARNFDPFRALSLSLLATLKHTPKTCNMDALVRPEDVVHTLMHHWSYSEKSGCGTFLPEFASMTGMFIKLNEKLSPGGNLPAGFDEHWDWNRFIGPMTVGKTETALLIKAVQAGAFSTALARLKGPRLEATWALVAASVQSYWSYSGPRLADFTSIINLLLESEASVNEELLYYRDYVKPPFFTKEPPMAYRCSIPWTLWTLLLQEAAAVIFKHRWKGDKLTPNLIYSLEMLLKQGADPNVCLVGYEVSRNKVRGCDSLRKVLQGPVRMDLPTIFSAWGFSIDCSGHVHSREGSSTGAHQSKSWVPHMESEIDLPESSLRDNHDADVEFIVVSVVARHQVRSLRNLELEASIQQMLDFGLDATLAGY